MVPYLLVAVPAGFLLAFFVAPNMILLSASLLESEGMVPTGVLTLGNFTTLLSHRIYVDAIIRTFGIGLAVGALVVLLAYPVAYVLVRTTSRWKNVLLALALSPLLASVIVRTYGWWVLFNRDGAVNEALQALHLTARPLIMLPSTAIIIVGLTHALLPYGVLTLMAALNGVSPNLERAAISLGAGRMRAFAATTLPLTAPGIIGGFLLAFGVAISAYATPAILGGPATQTMATLIYTFMATLLNWSLGSALGVVLLASCLTLLMLTALVSRRRALT
ncbi:MAG: ABC transporter permease [Acidisphaera sp.]|nr:ABC transporter permease [Acidisphaera sp.]